MNLQNPKFADVRVRRALSLGINREAIMNLVYPGLGKVLPMFPWIFLFDSEPTVEQMGDWTRYAPDEARQLLSAAGAEGMSLANTYYPYSSAYEQLADVMVDQFRQIGVDVTGGKAEYTEFNSQWTGRKLPEISTGGWTTIGFDADNYFYNCLHSQSGGNRWNLSDPLIDDLATKQQTELDTDDRKDILRQIWDHDLHQAYHPVVGSGTGFYVYQPWLRGIRFGGAMGSSNNYQDIGDMMGDAWLDK
jgi:ABC-type transport system substrate-binding protein